MTKETPLGKYLLFEQLGRGGYGTVYRAHDTVLDVERAVKVLPPALVADPAFIERFKREAKFAARMKHPHIVPVYDLGEAEGRFFLAMECMPGGSLKDVLEREKQIPFERALKIIHQIAEALDYIHEKDLIHRDVKPGNILFDAADNAALTDLGFAKALSGAGSASLSASGGMIGTPAYMAAEIWLGQEATPQTDVYSLGCVVYEMLTGQSLFGSGDSPPPVVMKRHFDPLQLPETWPTGVPQEITTVMEKALAKEPEARYAGPGAFASALEALEQAAQRNVMDGLLAGSPLPARSPLPTRSSLSLGEGPGARSIPPRMEDSMATIEQDESQETRLQEATRDELTPTPASAPAKPAPVASRGMSLALGLGALGLVILAVMSSLLLPLLSRPAATEAPLATEPPAATEAPLATELPPATEPPGIDSAMTGNDGMTLLYVPEGEFLIGSENGDNNERPVHTVYLDAYWIDETEVTNAMFETFVYQTGYQTDAERAGFSLVFSGSDWPETDGADWNHPQGPGSGINGKSTHPVIHVSWNDAWAYCEWAGRRLPTEAEWEKAARGTDGRTYPWGNDFDGTRVNFADVNQSVDWADKNFNDGFQFTAPVGNYPSGASPFGALDMAGNVWNGWQTGSVKPITRVRLLEILAALLPVNTAPCAAVRGTMLKAASALPTVAGALPFRATTPVSVVRSRNNGSDILFSRILVF